MRRPRRVCFFVLNVLLLTVAAHAQPTREVSYDPRAVIRLNAHLRMTTLVILPDDEEILDYVCGDKDFWIISGAQNLAYVKPAKAGATTNLNLVTAAGRVYSFLLVEGGNEPDLKVFVTLDPHVASPAKATASKVNLAADLERANQQLAIARDEVERAHQQSAETIERFKAAYPMRLRFPYAFKARAKPFNVTAIYTDDRFTYIRAEGRELPAVYEVVDHVPNLVSYQIEQGVYVISKIIDHGYLAIGKRRLAFDIVER
jgi:type IV secretory pathway VirB9-like protein